MSADGVRERVARSLWDLLRNHGAFTAADWDTCVRTAKERPDTLIGARVAQHQIDTDAVLAAIADHDGLVDVLRGHLRSTPAICPCGWVGTLWGDWDGEYSAHLADVVRAWLRGK